MAKDERYDTTDDIVRLPKDLKIRHDQLVEIRNARRDAEQMEKEKEKYNINYFYITINSNFKCRWISR
ncbi:PcfJ domain-containing protein [Romboutsia ilealis]|uniref:PcfJ domain-containing protein n=1 Tax=Romboutsia ilealis TaxID=1115758 RepID=UPI003AB97337